MADSLDTWVSDNLMRIVGLSDKRTVEYLIGVAKKSSSCDAVLATVKESGALPLSEANVGPFMKELWKRVPRRSAAASTATRGITGKVMSPSYKLVKSDSDSEETMTDKARNVYIYKLTALYLCASYGRMHDRAISLKKPLLLT